MKTGRALKTIRNLALHIGFYVNDLLTPIKVKVRTPKAFRSSKEHVLGLINLMKPRALSKPLNRFGPVGDGGYLAPEDFDGIVACFSPGVSDEAGFELELAQRGIPCFLIDASVKEAPIRHENITFEPLFLGSKSDAKTYISLEDWVTKKTPGEGDLILQIDIEGAEYEVLLAAEQELLRRFRLIIIELHELEYLMTNKYSALALEVFLKHLLVYFNVVHIHPNNNRRPIRHEGIEIPPVIEMTLVRKDRFIDTESPGSVFLPNTLDSDNSPKRKNVSFSKEWIR
jgi:FkbM family methyltransferase